MSLNKAKKLIKENFVELQEGYKVSEMGIFGSFAREEQDEGSDIDVLVEFQEPVGLFLFVRLANYLEDLLGRRVDLVTEEAIKDVIKDRVSNDMIYI